MYTVFLQIVSTEVILFWIWKLQKIVATNFNFLPNNLNSCCGNYSRKYGMYLIRIAIAWILFFFVDSAIVNSTTIAILKGIYILHTRYIPTSQGIYDSSKGWTFYSRQFRVLPSPPACLHLYLWSRKHKKLSSEWHTLLKTGLRYNS
jgi:hypothetical protein